MSAASLPYTVLLLLAEMAVGSLAMVAVFDARRQVTKGYVKAGALTIVPLAVLALWTYLAIGSADQVDGYRLDGTWFRPFGLLFAGFVAASVLHTVLAMLERRPAAVGVAFVGAGIGAASIVALAFLVAPPAWSAAGAVLSLLAGTAVLGASLMAMMWGHWYLTSGRLPKEPMEQMALVVLAALLLQAALVTAGALLPVRETPLSEGFGVGLAQNPAFWLRVVVGLVFPIGVTWLAWRAARIRGMMSATGLLYIALGAVLAGEVLARGLLFSTGAAV